MQPKQGGRISSTKVHQSTESCTLKGEQLTPRKASGCIFVGDVKLFTYRIRKICNNDSVESRTQSALVLNLID